MNKLNMNEDYVYSRIGMALVSAQRVEFLAESILEHLVEFDRTVYGITSQEFLDNSEKSKKARKMLGEIFKLLKLNPKLIIEHELDNYLNKRNVLVHKFWKEYLNIKSVEIAKKAVDFCYDFGCHSDRLSKFFEGFLFFLILRYYKDRDHVPEDIKQWDSSFEYFLKSLDKRKLGKICN